MQFNFRHDSKRIVHGSLPSAYTARHLRPVRSALADRDAHLPAYTAFPCPGLIRPEPA